METLYLIVTIDGQRVALAADPVESVVEIGAITPVPRAPPHIAGLAALRSRVLTIVDCLRSLELGATPSAGALQAVIVTVDSHQYGLLVEEVADVVRIADAPRRPAFAIGTEWARVAQATVEYKGEVLLLLDPAALIAGPIAAAA